jgi:hypothetical protein
MEELGPEIVLRICLTFILSELTDSPAATYRQTHIILMILERPSKMLTVSATTAVIFLSDILNRNHRHIQSDRLKIRYFPRLHQDPQYLGGVASMQSSSILRNSYSCDYSLYHGAGGTCWRSRMPIHCALRQRVTRPF